MGAGCVIVLWLFLATFAAAIWCTCLLAFVFARRKRWRVFSWFVAIPTALIPLAALLLAGVMIHGAMRMMTPRHVYQDVFKEAPSEDVRNIRSKAWFFADSGYVFLRFEATPETVERLATRRLRKAELTDESRHVRGEPEARRRGGASRAAQL